MNCPRCATPLEKNLYKDTVVSFFCPFCHGQIITLSALRALGVNNENSGNIWQAAKKGRSGAQLPCPECGKTMKIVKLDDGNQKFYIDVCIHCHAIWFDFGELDKIPVQPPIAGKDDELPAKAKEILALNDVKNINEQYEFSERKNFFSEYINIGSYGDSITRYLAVYGLRLLFRLLFKLPL